MAGQEYEAFVAKNLEFLTANQAKLAKMLSAMGSQPTGATPTATLKLNLDDDLKKAFNDVAGVNIQAQQLILQIQTDRRLSATLSKLTAPEE